MDKTKQIDIAIIGAGPAGLSAAVELSKRGYDNLIVFEREDEAGGVPRHCGHLGFGMFEFKRVLSGPDYSKKLVLLAEEHNITIALNYTLIKVQEKDNLLTFSTPDGTIEYTAKKTIFAMGAREIPRPSRFINGTRSPNIITTGALQRFVYINNRAPFKKAVIIGSEIVAFSALMTSKHAGIKIEAIIEEKEEIDSFGMLKPATKFVLQTPVYTGCKIVNIEGLENNITGITILQNGKEKTIDCDGIIFSGKFTPESAILQESFTTSFNHINNSAQISSNFQMSNKDFFLAGNVIRGVLAAFRCHGEGKKVAGFVAESLKEEEQIEAQVVNIDVSSDNIQWYYPSMIDLDSSKKSKFLTRLRLKNRTSGILKVFVNEREVWKKVVKAYPFVSIDIPWLGLDLKIDDLVNIKFIE